ncbi:MAG: patatin-like phospholipase family protein [Flavobacteriales bacterium]|nr:patatin-like phospholipase family protein [Flavobacteriales bacterium]
MNIRLKRFLFFFPFQLVVLHLKKSHLMLLLWLILFAFVCEGLGMKYGVPYLFLYPEYFGAVGFWSFATTGFAVGGFITAFNLYTYTMHGHRFPFIATLSRPFYKFSLNNALVPLLFLLTYLYRSAAVQMGKELLPPGEVAVNLLGFVVGVYLFLLVAHLYFSRTNTDLHKLTGRDPEEYRPDAPPMDIRGPMPPPRPAGRAVPRVATRWLRRQQRARKWEVLTYMSGPFTLSLARSSAHYDKELLREVLWQNHINASIFEVISVASFLLLGAFNGIPFFEIPAAASAFLLFTMMVMIIAALFSWFKGWAITVLVALVLLLNLVSMRTEGFLYDNEARGLDYEVPAAPYTRDHITALATDTAQAREDALRMQTTLERWRHKQDRLGYPGEKPPLVLVNVSGGGLRAMLWTLRCLQAADSALGGGLMDRTALITGSSGGLIGATYFRQLFSASLRSDTIDLMDRRYLDDLSTDLLNTPAFGFVTNDLFIRYRRVSDGTHLYTLDRGHLFERQLNKHTRGLFDIRLEDMADDEALARIPLLVINPTSINDGRRLLICSQPIAHLCDIVPDIHQTAGSEPESIEFQRLFADQGASKLKLSSALRMTSTFPYIFPVVTLPSEPPMRVMDSGVRDNYGYRTMLTFLRVHREWIAAHTSGVVLLQIRDKQKDLAVRPVGGTVIGRLVNPAGNVFDNFVRVQDQDYDLMLQQASAWMDFPLTMVEMQLRHADDDEISLSWHLTALEKLQVLKAMRSAECRNGLDALREAVLGTQLVDLSALADRNGAVPDRASDPTPLP